LPPAYQSTPLHDQHGDEMPSEPNIPSRATTWAWVLCWLMFASTVLNYMDRQAITLVKHEIGQSFSIPDSTDFGWILAAFSMTYALFQVPAGYLVDRWDIRWTYAAAVAWWSLAAMATAIVPTLGWLFACRALLGVGESFNWPCALRVTARVLPPRDRSLGNGIFNSGAAVGAVLTPMVVTFLSPSLGWQGTFLVIGSLGFIWVAVWIFLVRGPRSGMLARQGPATGAEPASTTGSSPLEPAAAIAFALVAVAAITSCIFSRWYGLATVWLGIAQAMLGPLVIAGLFPRKALGDVGWATSLHEIARLRRFWVLAVVSISINICWHFLVNWIPTYLRDDRGLGRSASGYLTSATFLAADLGNLGGGALSLWLATAGVAVVRARLTVLGLCIVLILAGTGLIMPQSDISAIVLLCLMATGTAAFMANFFAFTQDVSSKHIGLVVGYLGGLANLAVAAYQPFAGAIRDWTGSLIVNFLIVGLAPVVGLTVLILGWEGKKRNGQNRVENRL
jgi:ACS family hexuronate transporter-like MFS transporter